MALLKAKIVIAPLGEADLAMVNRLAGTLGGLFNRSVDILKGMRMPTEAYNETRSQYYARIILSKLERIKANNRETIIGVCEEDLYLPNAHYVLGYADDLSSTAIISLFHFRQDFYGLPEDDTKMYPRFYKEVVRQMSKLYSIPPCSNPVCVNFNSDEMMDIDDKSTRMCDVCLQQLQKVYIR